MRKMRKMRYIYPDDLEPIDIALLRKYGTCTSIVLTSLSTVVGRISHSVMKETMKSVPFNVAVASDIERRTVKYGKKHFETLSEGSETIELDQRRRKNRRMHGLIVEEEQKFTRTIPEFMFHWPYLDVPRATAFGGMQLDGAQTIPEASHSLKHMVDRYRSSVELLRAQRGLFLEASTEGGCWALNETLQLMALEGAPPTWVICIKPIPSKAARLTDFKNTLAGEVLSGIPNNKIIVFRDNRLPGGHKADYPAIVRPITALLGQKTSPDFTNILTQLRAIGPFARLDFDVVRTRVTEITTKKTHKMLGIIPYRRETTKDFMRDEKLNRNALLSSIKKLDRGRDRGDVIFVIGPLTDGEIAHLKDAMGITKELYFFKQATPVTTIDRKTHMVFNVVRWHPFRYDEIPQTLNIHMPSRDLLEDLVARSPQFDKAWMLAARYNGVDKHTFIKGW